MYAFKASRCWNVALFVSGILLSRYANGEYFDPELLESLGGKISANTTSLLSQGTQPPGVYRVRIEVNGTPLMYSSIRFALNKDKALYPCLSFQNYEKIGIDMEKIIKGEKNNAETNACIPIEKQIPDVKMDFDFSQLLLRISLPQSVMRNEEMSGVDISDWDDGIPAIFNTYQLSGQKYFNPTGKQSDSIFSNLTDGFNIGRWRYRNNSTINSRESWKNIDNYVETTIKSLKSELTLGDSSTDSNIFDSQKIRGLQLASDDDMTPDQLNRFAPVVRGIAKSNAMVIIREQGNIIYQRSVPPGPFAIRDLATVSDGGRLDVAIVEADGSETHYSQSYSSATHLLRQGQRKYSIAAGELIVDTENGDDNPLLGQLSLEWGLPLNMTAYGGVQISQKYNAVNSGLVADMQSLGAAAFDITQSHGVSPVNNNSNMEGKMARLTYHNILAPSDTQIEIDNRYYFQNYLSVSDWASNIDMDEDRKRYEINLSINQSLKSGNNFYATLNKTENKKGATSSMWQFGWSGVFEMINFSISYNMTRNEDQPCWDKQLALNISLPLSSFLPQTSTVLSYNVTSGLKGDLSNHLGVNGEIPDNRHVSWNTQTSWNSTPEQSDTHSLSAGLAWQENQGDADVTYTQDENHYLSWDASGSVLLHQHGITFGKYSSGSMALVSIPGAKNIPLENSNDMETDDNGYALVPDLLPYHSNSINIDTQNASRKYDFRSTSVHLVPTRDAIVLASFNAIQGHKAVITVTNNNKDLPFGSGVKIHGQEELYYIGDKGQVYIGALPDKGKLDISWGDNQTCSAPFTVAKETNSAQQISMFTVRCQS